MNLKKDEYNIENKSRIMIVEDELIVAQNIKNQLGKLGYEVPATADNGPDAIKNAEEHKPDLVLMDIRLSGPMDGIETADHIYSNYDIPVVYLTAYADNETLDRAKITDPFGYILKPFELKKLHSTIEIALYKHRMEKKLKASELRFRTLADSSRVGIFQTDTQGYLTYANNRWSQIVGTPENTSKGRLWSEPLHPEDKDSAISAWQSMMHKNEPFEKEFRFKANEGKQTWVHCFATPLKDDRDQKIGFIGTINDITTRKKLEEELLTSKKLESVGILAGGIAHDFNNLLSVIMGTISILNEDENLDDNQKNMLNSVSNASSQASELAQKLITFSGGGWLNRKKLDVVPLLNDTINNNFPDVNITLDQQGTEPVNGDPSQLKQVFANLIHNSIDAGNNNTTITITITTSNTENLDSYNIKNSSPGHKGKFVRITVADNGSGIDSKLLGKIFDPYFSTKEKGAKKGVGLGLTICYSIIQKHGGFIHVDSQHGNGTQVHVFLPVFNEENSTTNIKDAVKTSNGRIMIVDDEPIVQDVTRKMLERLGYDVDVFDEGRQALAAYEKDLANDSSFDIIFLDLVNKQGLGGRDTLAIMLQMNPDAIIIALSGYSNESDIAGLKAEGFADVLMKPYKLSDLKRVLDLFNRGEY
jgi:two-component system, cell cycle sensor histidine kinase and response regulator CckA